MDDWIRSWDDGDGGALLEALSRTFPEASVAEQRRALESLARGSYSSTSTLAGEALCRLAGLGNPCDTAYRLYNKSDAKLTDPQRFLWIAGYGYNWVCSGGLSVCYFAFDEAHFADRVRVYEVIGAKQAAQVMREADQAFGPNGPAATLAGRQAQITDALDARLDKASRRFWACGEEIYTQAYLYALEHPGDFQL